MTGNSEKDRRSQFSKQITFGDVLTLVVTSVAIASFYFALSGEVKVVKAIVKAEVGNLKESLEVLRDDVITWEADMNKQLWELLKRDSGRGK